MSYYKLKTYSKINLSLRVIKKNRDGYHTIQSFVVFCKPFDRIFVKEHGGTKDKVIFYGKFKNSINTKSNTVTKTLNLLRKENLLNKKFFKIYIEKNIPHGSGLGGGSTNAAILLNFLCFKKMKENKIYRLASKIGSDVPLCLSQKNSLITGKKFKIKRFSHNIRLNILVVFTKTTCSTKKIYSKNKKFSSIKSIPNKVLNNKKELINYLKNENNDLEKAVVTMYPKISNAIELVSTQKGCYFSRITGSGSACVGLFSSLKNANLAKKNIKKKFPKYWCGVSKTI